MRNLHHAANLHLSKENDFWPELAPYKMMIPGAKNCYPPGVRQTEKPYVKLWRNVLFQAHLGEVSLQDYVFSGEAGIVMKNEMILSINLHYHDFFAAKLIVCKDKFTYTMTSFPLRWLWLDKVTLQQRASSHPITQKGRSRVLPAVFIGNTVSEPKNGSKWGTWHSTFNLKSLGDFSIFGMKAFVRRSQRAPPTKHKNQFLVEMLSGYKGVWLKRRQTGITRALWGVPFPSPKMVQNEHFYEILWPKKIGLVAFEFWGESICAHTSKHGSPTKHILALSRH